jgi:lactoylglutathione lyase
MPTSEVRFNLFVIRSSDLDRAEQFYSALGLSFARHSHGNGPVHLASEQAGQVFEIYPVGKDGQGTAAARIGFSVPSVDEAHEALLAAGGKEVSAPKLSPWGRRSVVSDSDGHRVELTSPGKEIVD